MDIQGIDKMIVPQVVEDTSSHDSLSSLYAWFSHIKERLNTQEPWAVDLVFCGLIGFVVGFLMKNFGKIALLIATAIFVTLVVLHYTHVYPFPLEQIEALIGISHNASIQDIISVKVAFCREHPVACISGLVGIIVGWKVG